MKKAVSVLLTEPIVPYVRMTRRGKWMEFDRKGNPSKAQRYIVNQEILKTRIKEQLKLKGHAELPIFRNKQPLRCHITLLVHKDLHRKDLDNQIKALLDAAQGLIFENDLWIDTITAERSLSAEDLCELVLVSATAKTDLQAASRPAKVR